MARRATANQNTEAPSQGKGFGDGAQFLKNGTHPQLVKNAPAGVFTNSATLPNVSFSPIERPFFEVTTLTGGNLVLNAEGGSGGVGSVVTVPPAVLGGNGLLDPGESFVVEFEIVLQAREVFDLFVDAYGSSTFRVSSSI